MAGNNKPSIDELANALDQTRGGRQKTSGSRLGCYVMAIWLAVAGAAGGILYHKNKELKEENKSKYTTEQVQENLNKKCSQRPTSVIIETGGSHYETSIDGTLTNIPTYNLVWIGNNNIKTDKAADSSVPGAKPKMRVNVVGLIAADGNTNNEDDTNRYFTLRDIHKNSLWQTNNLSDNPFTEKYAVEVIYEGCKFPEGSKDVRGVFYLEFYKRWEDIKEHIDSLRKEKKLLEALELAVDASKIYNQAAWIGYAVNPVLADIDGYMQNLRVNKKFDKALEIGRNAIKIYPRSPYIHNRMGIILYDKNNYRGALTEFERALDLNPNDAAFNHNVGETYSELNDCAKGVRYMKEAVRLAPSNNEFARDLKRLEACASKPK